jgi:hypothetical protein
VSGGTGHPEDLVAVARTTDAGLLAVLRSVLEAAGVPFVVQGEAGVSLFPVGEFGSRVTGRTTGAVLLVPRDREEEARALLEAPPDEIEDEDEGPH